MEDKIDSQTVKRLNTWLPLGVFNELTRFAKTNAGTALEKFDYGVAIRILLMKSTYADLIYGLNKRMDEIEGKINNQGKTEVPEGFYEVKTLKNK